MIPDDAMFWFGNQMFWFGQDMIWSIDPDG